MQGRRIRVRTGAKGHICGEEVGEKDASDTMDDISLTGRGEEVAQTELQCRVGQERSVALVVSCCAVHLPLGI